MARAIAYETDALYLDLEREPDRRLLDDPWAALKPYTDRLVVLDEIHRAPELFQQLRGMIDEGRQTGKRTGRFLILGSASIDLLKQTGESLAGRITFVDLSPLTVQEVASDEQSVSRLWLRGGFPESYLAGSDQASQIHRDDLIRTYLEREIGQFGWRIPPERLRRLWTMIARNQGGMLNAAKLASALSISSPTVLNYIGLLVDLLLVRKLPPYSANIKKRLVKSPKVYIRDSGLLHALLEIGDPRALMSDQQVGASWEGFAIENILSVAPYGMLASFYRTSGGAEIDLVLERSGGRELWAIEIKLAHNPRPSRGFHQACQDLKPKRRFIVHPGEMSYKTSNGIEMIGLREMVALIGATKMSGH